MASIHKERRGGKTVYRLQFYDKDNRRRSIRLGAVNKKAADAICSKVEDLLSASISGGSPAKATMEWLVDDIGQDLADKLRTAGFGALIPKIESSTIGAFVTNYIESRTDASENTIRNWCNSKRKLVEFFGIDRDLRTISEGDADDFRQWLVNKGFADATIKMAVKHAKKFFKLAHRKNLVAKNPFDDVVAGSDRNSDRIHFVDRETIDRVIAATADVEWKLIIALARYGGFRTPSEVLSLKITDVDWAGERIVVTSPKTKRQGKGHRVIPLFEELREYLMDAQENAPDGAVYFISKYRDAGANLRTQFLRIIKSAGVAPWPRLFQNLRASRETELADQFPIHVATEWIGNTPDVAVQHYLKVTDDHFKQATQSKANSMGATVGAVIGGQLVSGNDTAPITAPTNTGNEVFPVFLPTIKHPLGESNPCLGTENPAS